MSVHKAFQNSVASLPASILQSARYAIAFSGGVDSTVLLHGAASYFGAHRCVALHIHHGLSAQADHWQQAAQVMAKRIGTAFVAHRVTVDTTSSQGIEAVARQARYSALSALCQREGASVLLLGHHADDQVETVWLQLLRGGGLRGIAAMPEKPVWRSWPQSVQSSAQSPAPVERNMMTQNDMRCAKEAHVNPIIWLRPFLSMPRTTIEAYANEHALSWIEDESNIDLRYSRNALRHDVLPRLAQYFPAYRAATARLARHAAQAQDLLDDLAEIDLLSVQTRSQKQQTACSRYVLSLCAFQALLHRSYARAVNMLRYWMRIEGVPQASSAWLDEVCRQLSGVLQKEAQPSSLDAVPTTFKPIASRILHATRCLSIYRGEMYWQRAASMQNSACFHSELHSDALSFQWQGEDCWPLSAWHASIGFVMTSKHDAQGVPAAWLRSKVLTVRERCGKERIRLKPGAPSRTLKKCFQQARIPAWQRALPLIYIDETLLFVPYIGMNLGNINIVPTDDEFKNKFEGFVRLQWRAESL